ncbi:MAG TPA: MFS transporter [Candidatus Eisenbacteria bacterium]|nr:MFS transporter [Candidatus Eisenbacteria bacterium]
MTATHEDFGHLSREFQTRRTLNWLALGILYALFYMTRYNWTVASPTIADILGWRNTQLGVFETMLPLVYGLSVVLNGPLADRIGGRKAFLFGAVGVVLMNLAFGLAGLAVATPAVWQGAGMQRHVVQAATLRHGLTPGGLMTLMVVVWGLNGFFQSFGALSIVKVNAQWFHVRERGTFSGVFGLLIRMGLLLAFQGVPLILLAFPWPYAFWIPAAGVAVFFGINLLFMRDSPRDAGLGEFETGDEAAGDDRPIPLADVIRRIFGSRVTWTIALGSMMIGFVRRSVIDAWWPKYFVDYFGADKSRFATYAPYLIATWGIAVAGVLGGFAFGIASDRRFGGRRAPVILFGFVGMALLLAAAGVSDRLHLGPVAAACWLVLLSFCVNGAHGMIGGAASMDFGGRKAAATAAGMFDGVQYLAGAFVGVGVGWITTRWGWEAWHWAPIPFALAGAGLMAGLWNVLPRGAAAPPAAQPGPSRSSPA